MTVIAHSKYTNTVLFNFNNNTGRTVPTAITIGSYSQCVIATRNNFIYSVTGNNGRLLLVSPPVYIKSLATDDNIYVAIDDIGRIMQINSNDGTSVQIFKRITALQVQYQITASERTLNFIVIRLLYYERNELYCLI